MEKVPTEVRALIATIEKSISEKKIDLSNLKDTFKNPIKDDYLNELVKRYNAIDSASSYDEWVNAINNVLDLYPHDFELKADLIEKEWFSFEEDEIIENGDFISLINNLEDLLEENRKVLLEYADIDVIKFKKNNLITSSFYGYTYIYVLTLLARAYIHSGDIEDGIALFEESIRLDNTKKNLKNKTELLLYYFFLRNDKKFNKLLKSFKANDLCYSILKSIYEANNNLDFYNILNKFKKNGDIIFVSLLVGNYTAISFNYDYYKTMSFEHFVTNEFKDYLNFINLFIVCENAISQGNDYLSQFSIYNDIFSLDNLLTNDELKILEAISFLSNNGDKTEFTYKHLDNFLKGTRGSKAEKLNILFGSYKSKVVDLVSTINSLSNKHLIYTFDKSLKVSLFGSSLIDSFYNNSLVKNIC